MTKLLACLALAVLPAAAQPNWKEFSIGPATRAQTRFGPDGLQGTGVTTLRAIAVGYGIPETRIAGPEWLATQRYAITALVASPADFQPLFQQELAKRFNLEAHREQKEASVYVLKLPEGAPHKLRQSDGGNAGGEAWAGSIMLPGFRLVALVRDLESALHRPVIDETGLAGNFDISLTWDPGNDVALVNARPRSARSGPDLLQTHAGMAGDRPRRAAQIDGIIGSRMCDARLASW